MSEKKRKRHDDGRERPAKKTVVVPPSRGVRFEFVENEDVLGPVLAITPGLNFPGKLNFKPYTSKDAVPELLLQSSDHPRLDYTAREEKDGSSDSLLKDYIGVFDPNTGKLQVVEMRKVTLRSTLRSETEEMQEASERIAAAKATMTAQRHALATEFGSKKSKKAILDMASNAISRGKAGNSKEEVMNDQLSSTVLQGISGATSAMPTRDELAAAVDAMKPRPQANLTAEHAADVYTIDNVIGSELMQLIEVKNWVNAAEKGENIDVHSKYVARRIVKLAKTKEIQKLKVLKFMQLCMNFNISLKAKGRGPKSIPFKDKLVTAMGTDASEAVVNGIRRKFASENNDMPRWNIDNLMTHVAAAALIVDNFEVDVNDLREDLRLENKEIRQYFIELGCRLSNPTEADRARLKISKAEGASHSIAKLKLPLQFPKVKAGPRKKR